jgi:hypothetical protein
VEAVQSTLKTTPFEACISHFLLTYGDASGLADPGGNTGRNRLITPKAQSCCGHGTGIRGSLWLFVMATALNTMAAAVLAVIITLGVVRPNTPQLIVVNSASPYRTLADLMNTAHAKPKTVTLANARASDRRVPEVAAGNW